MKNLLTRKSPKLWRRNEAGDKIDDGSLPSGLRGNCTGLRGNCTGLIGDVDECEITDKERKAGVGVATLVATEESNG